MINKIKQSPSDLRLYIQKGDPLIQIHMPDEMLEALAIKAIESSYSIESEILSRLAHSLTKPISGLKSIKIKAGRKRK